MCQTRHFLLLLPLPPLLPLLDFSSFSLLLLPLPPLLPLLDFSSFSLSPELSCTLLSPSFESSSQRNFLLLHLSENFSCCFVQRISFLFFCKKKKKKKKKNLSLPLFLFTSLPQVVVTFFPSLSIVQNFPPLAESHSKR